MDLDRRDRIQKKIEPLFRYANKNNLWFRTIDHQPELVFSPKELRDHQTQGRYLFGPIDWTLIDPLILLKDEALELFNIRKFNKELRTRIENGRE